jgi:hypothetical protein
MLVREGSTGNIDAAGIIDSIDNSGSGGYYWCFGQNISSIRSSANVKLIWG